MNSEDRPGIYTVAGGFHLVLTPYEEIQRTAHTLYSDLRVDRGATSTLE